ncbi:hypothetical protein OS493_030418 [Desmophyllum pertusum]|uniref:G-protein coupled receptors family 1 profile domain-containing protein n=1 Tax=Desmophyllum pertusum TaxID=174260 RepID=A0A9X0CVL4_9CNID|nr:hypothetical protein OS493_030418 [Desmophyllum pertusum]
MDAANSFPGPFPLTEKEKRLGTKLDLSFNPLQRWEGDVITQLPNLVTLKVTGSAWTPDSNILSMPLLGCIVGVTWSDECVNCSLWKMNISILNLEGGNSNPVLKFIEHGFYPFCSQMKPRCFPRFLFLPSDTERTKITSVPKRLFYSSYIMGAIAVILNMIILITVMSSRSLCQTTSMLLITNMALCDLLIGIYSIIIGSLNIFNFLSNVSVNLNTDEKLVLGGGILCPLAAVIFTSAECVAAVTSLLLTVEKYCSIVYCMNPDRRLSKKVAAVCLLFAWILSLGYALSPFLRVLNISYSATMMCSFPVAEKNTFLICLGVLIALYLTNIPLYVGIFRFVRHSGAQLGVKREAAILKKIALVVGSNFVLLLTPMILIITFVPVKSIHHTIQLNSDSSTQVLFVFGFWFPIACLGLNSCINPILCAFRQGQFVKRIRKVLKLPRIPSFVETLRRHEGTASLSQLSTASSQIVLCKVTHLDS